VEPPATPAGKPGGVSSSEGRSVSEGRIVIVMLLCTADCRMRLVSYVSV
jgi:hypothetical protein